jgi:hypothetical protein
MKRFIIVFIFISNYIFASYLVVGDSANLPIANDGEIILNPISIDFSNVEVSSNGRYIDIPIYVKSDTTEAISMKMSNILALTQGSESIGITLSYRGSSINSDVLFTLMNDGEGGRDGNTVVGNIRVTIPSVYSAQTYGTYNNKIDMALSSNNYNSQALNYLNISANVPLVAVAGFDIVSSYTNGQRFLDATVNYGSFDLNRKNSIEKSLFIKSNSKQNFKLSFDTTKLVSKINSNYKIPLNYYFNNTPFINNQYFTALSGENTGESTIGVIKFETETISSSLISGSYEAIINVTISLE